APDPPVAANTAMPVRFQPSQVTLASFGTAIRAAPISSMSASTFACGRERKLGFARVRKPADELADDSFSLLVTASMSQAGASAIGRSFSQRYSPTPGLIDGDAITMPPSPRISTPGAIPLVLFLMYISAPGCR